MKSSRIVQEVRVTSTIITDDIKKWEYSRQNEYGNVYGYVLYPGIYLWKNDFHMKKIPNQVFHDDPYMKLNYCLKGRCEASLGDNRFVYLEPGVVSLDRNRPENMFVAPSGRYKGIEIIMDMNILAAEMPGIFSDLGIPLTQMYEQLRRSNGSTLSIGSKELHERAERFGDLLGTSPCTVEACRLEMLQLLYSFTHGHTTPAKELCYLTKGQKSIAMEVEAKISADLKTHYTVEDLAKEYRVSTSSLEKYFVGVYGASVAKYIREKRMKRAAEILSETSLCIADVAAEVGYSSQSKFGSAFKLQTGETPMEYRRSFFLRKKSTNKNIESENDYEK